MARQVETSTVGGLWKIKQIFSTILDVVRPSRGRPVYKFFQFKRIIPFIDVFIFTIVIPKGMFRLRLNLPKYLNSFIWKKKKMSSHEMQQSNNKKNWQA